MSRQRDQKQGGRWAGNDIQQLLGWVQSQIPKRWVWSFFQGRIFRNKNGPRQIQRNFVEITQRIPEAAETLGIQSIKGWNSVPVMWEEGWSFPSRWNNFSFVTC